MKSNYVTLTTFAFLCSLFGGLFMQESQAAYLVNRFDIDLPMFDVESGTPYKNCGGSESTLESVDVSPCDAHDGDSCVIQRGSNVTFHMSFLSKVNTKTLKAKIYGVKDWIPVPFPCPEPNACKNSGIVCPIAQGKLYNYTLSAPIKDDYPKISLWVKGELIDDHGNNLLCVEIPIKLV